ncbi:S-layer protein [Candidatus Woesearchaeota archaeon]|nr:S-layer protein [Candidatus Woesearchaeota archaeon]
MKVKNAIKKIVALATGATMLGATVMGAMAMDLSEYPEPFVVDGVYEGNIVLGSTAMVDDVISAVDIAASLQRDATIETPISGGSVGMTGESVLIEGSASDLNFGDALSDIEDKLTKDDFPTILADGTVEDDSTDDEFDYDQEIHIGGDSVTFGPLDEEDYMVNTDLASNEIPVLYIDMSSGAAYTVVVDFDDEVNVSGLDDSETITIAGKEFTFDPDMDSGDTDIILYSSDVTQVLSIGESAVIDGTEIEIVGANTDSDTATLRIDGELEQVEEGDKVGDIYINEIFMQTIPTESAAVKFFVGSEEVTLSDGDTVEVDNEDLEGVEVDIDFGSGSDIDTIEGINFTITPGDMDEDEKEALEIGEDFVDPLFGTFKVSFVDVVPELEDDDKDFIELKRSGDELVLKFKNRDGDEYEVIPYEGDGSDITVHEDWYGLSGNYTNMVEGQIFILTEGSGSSAITKIYELDDIDTGSDNEVTLKDLSGGSFTVDAGDEIEDTDVYVCPEDFGGTTLDDNISLSSDSACDNSSYEVAVETVIYTIGDMTITLGDEGTPAGGAIINLEEATASNEDETTPGDINITLDSTSDNDIEMSLTESSVFTVEQDDDGDVDYGVSEYGTYVEVDVDNDGDYAYIWTPDEEADYKVYFSELSSEKTSAAGDTSTDVNPIAVGMAILDNDADDLGDTPYIVVGGPCVNTVAMELMGNPAVCTEGFEEGKAVLKIYEDQSALLVAGMTAQDTTGAGRVLANYEDYELSGNEMEVITTDLSDLQVQEPTEEAEE